jgi:hypothetical protein
MEQSYLEVLTRLRDCIRRKRPDSGVTSRLSTMSVLLRMISEDFASY